jgi:Tfp pilus assembly pilus retraction ATPase PilT
VELNEILKIALKGGASDIHLKPGLPAMFRVDGALVPLKAGETRARSTSPTASRASAASA